MNTTPLRTYPPYHLFRQNIHPTHLYFFSRWAMWWMYVYLLQHFYDVFPSCAHHILYYTLLTHNHRSCSFALFTFFFYFSFLLPRCNPLFPSDLPHPFASHPLISSPPYTSYLRHTSPSGIVTESESNYTAFILLSLSLIVCC